MAEKTFDDYIMHNRELIKKEIDILPDSILEKLQEFILFQKYYLRQSINNKNNDDLLEASMSSTDFWDNEYDEVWNDV